MSNEDSPDSPLLGPKNRQLGADFLTELLKCFDEFKHTIPKSGEIEAPKKCHYYTYWKSYYIKSFYKPFLERIPKVEYNGDTFVIKQIILADFSFDMKPKTYKDAFELCDQKKPPPRVCPCEESGSENVSDSSDDELDLPRETRVLFSFEDILNKSIKFEGSDVSYFSQPSTPYGMAGAQFQFEMTFCYSQDDLSIYVVMGPDKRIQHICTGTSNGEGYFAKNRQVDYSYEPDMLWFDESSMRSIKLALQKQDRFWTHSGRTYEIVDKKFCKANRDDRSCGCCYNWCDPMSDSVGIASIPSGISYRRNITVTCAPEWYIQYQISSCSDYTYCARILLDLVSEDLKAVKANFDAIKDFYPYQER